MKDIKNLKEKKNTFFFMQTSLKIFDNCCKNTFHVQYPLFRVIGAVNVGLELEN